MKVCIYLRKSRAEENMSIEEVLDKHKTTLLAYAQKHKLNVLDIKEEVVSGESITRRPKMLELLKEVEDSKYDAVLVMDIDRLGRGNMREQGLILETFKEYNTKIITPNKTYDLENEFDEEYSEFEAFMARRELKIIKKRLMRGRMKSLEQGNYISPYSPFGYEKKDKILVINEEQANVVKLIFSLYVDKDYGDTKISKYLTEHKIKNKSGNTDWDRTTIRKIIQNPVYIGKITWNKRKYKFLDSGKRTSKFLDRNEWTIFEGKHEAIIEKDVFDKAQELSKQRYVPHLHSKKKLRNPIAGLVKCGSCGATMTIRTCKGKKDTLRCYKACGVKSSYIYLVEERLLESVLKELQEIKFKIEYQEEKSIDDTEINVLNDTIKSKEKQIETLKQQKNKLFDLLEQGIYDNDTFLERMNKITTKIDSTYKDIQSTKNKLEKMQDNINSKKNRLPIINDSIKCIKSWYNEFDAERKNKFLKTIIEKVEYKKEKNAEKEEFELVVYLKL